MKIQYFDTLPSTQDFLTTQIKQGIIDYETCIIAKTQTDGIGSRGNQWSGVEKGLYLSFAKSLESLPKDLKSQSMAIFFAFIFMESLRNLGSKIWLKYPNDLFLDKEKIGGAMCGIAKNYAVCGIGLNIYSSTFSHLEKNIGKWLCENLNSFLKTYFYKINLTNWSEVFHAYKAEFHKNADFCFHYENNILSLKNAVLQSDGAIKIGNNIIYNVR